MKRDDIYDHLAQVYLGKRSKKDEQKEKRFSAWLVINILITVIIFSSAFYGLTAFLTHHNSTLQSRIIYSLHNGPIRIPYDLVNALPPEKMFTIDVGTVDASKYRNLAFSIRGKEDGVPGVVRLIVRNKRNEEASYYVQGIGLDWQEISIPFSDFQQITDFSTLTDITFVLESWNVQDKKGLVLIDEIRFSS